MKQSDGLQEYIIPWTMEGETKIRARSAQEARAKFDAKYAAEVAADHDDLKVHGVQTAAEWDAKSEGVAA